MSESAGNTLPLCFAVRLVSRGIFSRFPFHVNTAAAGATNCVQCWPGTYSNTSGANDSCVNNKIRRGFVKSFLNGVEQCFSAPLLCHKPMGNSRLH